MLLNARVMSASEGKEEASILEDPNALRHMDALFDVLRKPAERKSRGSPAVAVSAAAELAACGAPAADMEFLLDALFAVVQTDPAAGSGGKGGGSRVAKTAAKSWRERGLPASFFDSSRSCTNSSDGGSTEIAGAPGAGIGGAGKAPSSVPSPVSLAKVQASNSVTASPGLSPVPVVLVANAGATESYTFYIE